MPTTYIKKSSGWTEIKSIYIKKATGWVELLSAYVKKATGWVQVFSALKTPGILTFPKVRNAGGSNIDNITYIANTGDTLYGYRGSWSNTPTSYEDKWQWSTYSGGPYSDFSPSQTATTLDTSTHINTWNKRYIVYVVRATNSRGTSDWVASSNEAYLQKYAPSNIDISISGTAAIGETLIAISHWETTLLYTGDWTPETYLYEWIYGDTGTAAFNSTNSSNYTITSEDLGHTIKVKITATNSGGFYPATSAATSTITVATPTNSVKPTFSLLSGTANKVGSIYRLSAGSWLNTPTSYTYYLDRNNAGGTNVLSLNQSGAYYDWTVGGTYGGNTLSFSVSATNAGGTSAAVYCLTSLGAFTYSSPTAISYPSISGTGVYNTNIIYAAGSYNYAASITTQLIISSNTSFTSTSGAKGGTSPYTVNNIDVAGTPYTFATRDTVVGLDGNTYYFYSGGFSGTSVTIPNGSGSILSSALAGLTPTLSAITKTAGGFTTALTNYNASYTWDVITSAGSVSPTTLTGNQTITVSGLGNAASATVTVFSSRSGYQTLNTPIVGTSKALYTVTYSVINGGTVSPPSESVYEGASVNLPTPVLSGYTAKWYTAASGGTLIGSPTDLYTPSASITLYARWIPNTYTITYLKNDGSGTAQGTSTFTTGGTTVAASTPTRAGYAFNGWYDTGSLDYTYFAAADAPWYPPANSFNMYARWTLIQTAPSGGSASITGTATMGNSLTLSKTAATGTPTPTATWIWQRNSGGVGGNTYQTVQTNGDTYSLTNFDVGYNIRVVVTWTNAVSPDQVVTTGATSAVLGSYWTVSYNVNGGTGSITSTSILKGAAGNVTASTPTPPSGYSFVNWNTASNGTGTSYSSSAVITPTADTPLYAQYAVVFVTPAPTAPTSFIFSRGLNGGTSTTRRNWFWNVSSGMGSYSYVVYDLYWWNQTSQPTTTGTTGYTSLLTFGSAAGTAPVSNADIYDASGNAIPVYRTMGRGSSYAGTNGGTVATGTAASWGKARCNVIGTNGTTYTSSWTAYA